MRRMLSRPVFLVGFSGSGKTTVGKALGRSLGVAFVDTDKLIEWRARKSIADIFTEKGEIYFRRIESSTIRKLASSRVSRVVALGGGAFQSIQNRQLVSEAGVSIFLSCSVKELLQRLKPHADRPLLASPGKSGRDSRAARIRRIKKLLCRRLPAYHTADVRISTTGKTVRQVVTLIRRKLKGCRAAHSSKPC